MTLMPGILRDLPMGFLLHILIEVPASINFLLFPSRQLETFSPQAHAVIRQYALLLLTSVLIALIFLLRPVDDLSGQVAGVLSLYHIGPALRSIARLRFRLQENHPILPSEAALYLLLHTATGASLAYCFWSFHDSAVAQ
jgi:hypothetical protein